MKDSTQQIPLSFDLSPGKNQVYHTDSTKEWVYPSRTTTPTYTNQTDSAHQSTPSQYSRTLTDNQIDILFKKIRKPTQATLARDTHHSAVPKITFTNAQLSIIKKIQKVSLDLGLKLFIAGGLLRDKLLGLPTEDLDFVVDKDAELLAKEVARRFDLDNPVKLERSGAIMLYMDNSSIDIISAAKVFTPLVSKNRNQPDGKEGDFSVFIDDAFRRDLTINSLMYDVTHETLIDPTGRGLFDLQNKILRTIINPHVKYKVQPDDILRALRFFAVKPMFSFAPDMLDAMRENAHKLTPITQGGEMSSRRIERELSKAAKTERSWSRMKKALEEVGLLRIFENEVNDIERKYKHRLNLASDYAGRPLPDVPVLPTIVNYPYQMRHDNYSGESILKQKIHERKNKKIQNSKGKKIKQKRT